MIQPLFNFQIIKNDQFAFIKNAIKTMQFLIQLFFKVEITKTYFLFQLKFVQNAIKTMQFLMQLVFNFEMTKNVQKQALWFQFQVVSNALKIMEKMTDLKVSLTVNITSNKNNTSDTLKHMIY